MSKAIYVVTTSDGTIMAVTDNEVACKAAIKAGHAVWNELWNFEKFPLNNLTIGLPGEDFDEYQKEISNNS